LYNVAKQQADKYTPPETIHCQLLPERSNTNYVHSQILRASLTRQNKKPTTLSLI